MKQYDYTTMDSIRIRMLQAARGLIAVVSNEDNNIELARLVEQIDLFIHKLKQEHHHVQ